MNKNEAIKYIGMCISMSKKDDEIIQLLLENGYAEDQCVATVQDVRSIIDQEQSKKSVSIRGWLFLLLANIAIIGISCLLGFVFAWLGPNSRFPMLLLGDSVRLLGTSGLVIYTIYAFCKRKNNAVFFAIALLAIWALWDFVFLIVSNSHDDSVLKPFVFGRDMLVALGWIAYLYNSKRIQRMFPEEERFVSLYDKIIVAVIVVIPLILLLFSL